MFTTLLVALDGGPQHDTLLDLVTHVTGPRSRIHLLCVLDPEFALPVDASDADRREYPAAARQRASASGGIGQLFCKSARGTWPSTTPTGASSGGNAGAVSTAASRRKSTPVQVMRSTSVRS